MTHMNIKDLVDLCQKGDEQGLNLLYMNYSEKMMKICLHYIPEPTIAQDLLHDGFIIIFTSIRSLRNPEKLESWMKKFMKNIALRYLNQTSIVTNIPLTDISEEEEPSETPFYPDFVSYHQMLDMVDNLPEGYRKVFKLAVLEGLSHKEIGELLGIAPHSSSSQLFRAKALLRKMLTGYRVVIVLVLLLLFPMLYEYLHKEKRTIAFKEIRSTGTATQYPKTEKRPEERNVIESRRMPHYDEGKCRNITAINRTAPLPDVLPLTIPETQDYASKLFITNPFITVNRTKRDGISYSFPQTKLLQNKKSSKWKLMLTGSLGPQLAQSLYKLMATPQTDASSGHLPQQVSTWEEYYSYLNTRYQQGILGNDSVGLMQVAESNSGRIIEHQHHEAPITAGLSLSKKLNGPWSLKTGLNYTYLKSEFSTGEEYHILETQKLHYIGIPLRLSYRFWNYKRLSCYASAGIQIDIPVKGTLQTSHTTDSIPNLLKRQSLTPPIQWSVNTNAGIQYYISPHTSIYIEPTVNYYIPDGSELRTIRKEHPFTFTMPIGIRFSW